MTDYFVSGAGDNSDGLTWAKAKTTYVGAETLTSAGDRIVIDKAHNETFSASKVLLPSGGTDDNPVVVLTSTVGSGTTVAYAKATAITFENTNVQNIDMTLGKNTVWIGVEVLASDELNIGELGDPVWCIDVNMTSSRYDTGGLTTPEGEVFLQDCQLTAGGTDSAGDFVILNTETRVIARNLTLVATTTHQSTDALFSIQNDNTFLEIDGLDSTGYSCGEVVVAAVAGNRALTHCKITNGALNAATNTLINRLTSAVGINAGDPWLVEAVDESNTVNRRHLALPEGDLLSETGITRTGGASDGLNAFSVKLTTEAQAREFYQPARFKLADLWVDNSISKTLTVHGVRTNASTTPDALQDDEWWIEVMYPDGSTAKGLFESDRMANISSTPADQTTSTESWANLLTNSTKQQCAVTLTASEEGPVRVWVCVAFDSTTDPLYVCPKVEVA